MSHIGILLSCDHYPCVSKHVAAMSPRLRAALAVQGHAPEQLSVYSTQVGTLPEADDISDAWIVSGTPRVSNKADTACVRQLVRIIRRASRMEAPLFGLYRGEHLIRFALSGGAAPWRDLLPSTPRNPLAVFQRSDRLFRWDTTSGRLKRCDVPDDPAPLQLTKALPALEETTCRQRLLSKKS